MLNFLQNMFNIKSDFIRSGTGWAPEKTHFIVISSQADSKLTNS